MLLSGSVPPAADVVVVVAILVVIAVATVAVAAAGAAGIATLMHDVFAASEALRRGFVCGRSDSKIRATRVLTA